VDSGRIHHKADNIQILKGIFCSKALGDGSTKLSIL